MTTEPVRARRPLGPYREEELLVALQHEQMVRDVLEELGVESEVIESSDLLGLSRLSILVRQVDAADFCGKGLQAVGLDRDEKARARWREQLAEDTSQASLGQVLWTLREVFAARYAGWIPTMGKNRFLAQVHGAGEVIHGTPPARDVMHGGGDEPVPVNEGEQFEARAEGPGRGVRVGVLDTAVYPHPWLAGGWTASFSDTFDDAEPPPTPQGHATFIAGLILQQAGGATVKVRQILAPDGVADSWEVAKTVVEFGSSGLDVLNLSFACYTDDGQPPLALAVAMDRLDPDLVVVAAAGNHGKVDPEHNVLDDDDTRRPAWPAALDDVIAVGATDRHGKRADFSPDAWWVDVVTRGTDVLSTYLPAATTKAAPAKPGAPAGAPGVVTFPGAYARWSGTSFAAAVVAGAIAAKTEPGRTSAREAAQQVLGGLQRVPPAAAGSPSPRLLPPPRFATPSGL